MRFSGFEPYFNADSKILILGSFPSVIARREGFYYGNKQNRFWKILSEILSEELPKSNGEKKELLKRHQIALWDIVDECEIKGSMDSEIKNPKIADISRLLDAAPIKTIICNGKTAHSLLLRHFPKYAHMTVYAPSTSPANPKCDKEQWRKVLLDG